MDNIGAFTSPFIFQLKDFVSFFLLLSYFYGSSYLTKVEQ